MFINHEVWLINLKIRGYKIRIGLVFELLINGDIKHNTQTIINNFGDLIYNFRRVSIGWKEKMANIDVYKEGESFSCFKFQNKIISIGLCGDFRDKNNIKKINE